MGIFRPFRIWVTISFQNRILGLFILALSNDVAQLGQHQSHHAGGSGITYADKAILMEQQAAAADTVPCEIHHGRQLGINLTVPERVPRYLQSAGRTGRGYLLKHEATDVNVNTSQPCHSIMASDQYGRLLETAYFTISFSFERQLGRCRYPFYRSSPGWGAL